MTIKEIRLKKNMTLEIASKKIGIGPTHLHYIETGKREPSFSVINNMVKVYKVTPTTIFEALNQLKVN